MPADIADRSAPLRVEPSIAGVGGPFRLLSTSVADRDITVYYTVYGCLCVATVLIDVEQDRSGSFDYPTVTAGDLDGAEDAWVCAVAMEAWRAEPDAVMARLCGRARRETPATIREPRISMHALVYGGAK